MCMNILGHFIVICSTFDANLEVILGYALTMRVDNSKIRGLSYYFS